MDAIPSAGLALETLDESSLYDALIYVIDNRQLLHAWQANAPKLAEGFTIASYQETIFAFLNQILEPAE